MKIPFFRISLALSALLAGSPALAAPRISADTKIEEGITKTIFQMEEGFITVYLPAELHPGDTISGSMAAKPFGGDAESKEANMKALKSCSIELRRAAIYSPEPMPEKVKKIEPPVATFDKPLFSGTIPEKTRGLEVVLVRDGRKLKYDRLKVESDEAVAVDADSCMIPAIAQGNHPTLIKMRADGLAENTEVSVGGKRCEILAESPRMIVFRSPADVVGATTVSFSEGGRGARCDLVNLQVKLSASQLRLKKGERSKMTVSINGLKSASQPVELVLSNMTPQVVQIIGGDQQVVPIPAGGVQ
ncbi:MAG: hypothetical protein AB7V06_26475 [Candidatus Obscuribacterales bacterium]